MVEKTIHMQHIPSIITDSTELGTSVEYTGSINTTDRLSPESGKTTDTETDMSSFARINKKQ